MIIINDHISKAPAVLQTLKFGLFLKRKQSKLWSFRPQRTEYITLTTTSYINSSIPTHFIAATNLINTISILIETMMLEPSLGCTKAQSKTEFVNSSWTATGQFVTATTVVQPQHQSSQFIGWLIPSFGKINNIFFKTDSLVNRHFFFRSLPTSLTGF